MKRKTSYFETVRSGIIRLSKVTRYFDQYAITFAETKGGYHKGETINIDSLRYVVHKAGFRQGFQMVKCITEKDLKL